MFKWFKRTKLWGKWHLFIRILPLIALIIVVKLLFHRFGLEVIALNALFTTIIAATTFLIGFLITGVISDYKESEKIPSELTASLEVIHDEAEMIYKVKKSPEAKAFLKFHEDFMKSLNDWFYQKEKTANIYTKINEMNDHFIKLESQTSSNSLSRMKTEQNAIRKFVLRIHTIRGTDFVQSAYAIVETLAFFLVLGFMLLKQEPFYEALFFTIIVSFMVLYMIFLIKDLDNPFDYAAYGENSNEVSLKPFHDLQERIKIENRKMIGKR